MELINRKTTEHRLQNTDKGRQGSEGRGQASECDHGGNVYKAARELGIPESRIIDFSASINPLGISERVKAALSDNIEGLVHYPDPGADNFRRVVSRLHGIDSGMILPGNGSTELIYLLPRALKPGSVLIPSPTFSEYERACRMDGYVRVKRYALRSEHNFEITSDGFIEEMQGCHMAFLCNPNNPTGNTLAEKEVLKIADAAAEMQCLLIVDEAFIDYAPQHSVTHHVKDYPYLVVLRSLTKFYALTGLRVGYAVLSQELLERTREFKEPWTVNSLAQKAAIIAMNDQEYIAETRNEMAKEKKYLEHAFVKLGITYIPSSVNFYLLNIDRAETIALKLRQKGILVRDCSNFRDLDGSYMRIAVRSREDNEMLLKEFAQL